MIKNKNLLSFWCWSVVHTASRQISSLNRLVCPANCRWYRLMCCRWTYSSCCKYFLGHKCLNQGDIEQWSTGENWHTYSSAQKDLEGLQYQSLCQILHSVKPKVSIHQTLDNIFSHLTCTVYWGNCSSSRTVVLNPCPSLCSWFLMKACIGYRYRYDTYYQISCTHLILKTC